MFVTKYSEMGAGSVSEKSPIPFLCFPQIGQILLNEVKL